MKRIARIIMLVDIPAGFSVALAGWIVSPNAARHVTLTFAGVGAAVLAVVIGWSILLHARRLDTLFSCA